tara:strand:- start:2848 stop:3249 length:402 start_codon:yes stop_codon:yes gene_type:complete
MGKKLNKEELGNKVLCPECEMKFYDLGKTSIVCPSCEFSFSKNNIPAEKTDEDQTVVIEAIKSEEVVSHEEVGKDSEKNNEDEVLPEVDEENLDASKDNTEKEEENIEDLEEFDLEDDIDESIDDNIDGEETF